jgi:hypothetical protein
VSKIVELLNRYMELARPPYGGAARDRGAIDKAFIDIVDYVEGLEESKNNFSSLTKRLNELLTSEDAGTAWGKDLVVATGEMFANLHKRIDALWGENNHFRRMGLAWLPSAPVSYESQLSAAYDELDIWLDIRKRTAGFKVESDDDLVTLKNTLARNDEAISEIRGRIDRIQSFALARLADWTLAK